MIAGPGGDADLVCRTELVAHPRHHASINYRHVELDRDGHSGKSGGIVSRLLLMLE